MTIETVTAKACNQLGECMEFLSVGATRELQGKNFPSPWHYGERELFFKKCPYDIPAIELIEYYRLHGFIPAPAPLLAGYALGHRDCIAYFGGIVTFDFKNTFVSPNLHKESFFAIGTPILLKMNAPVDIIFTSLPVDFSFKEWTLVFMKQ